MDTKNVHIDLLTPGSLHSGKMVHKPFAGMAFRLLVKCSGWEQYGIFRGDILCAEETDFLKAGQLLILRFEEKLVVRKLEQCRPSFLLVPLGGKIASLEWPCHVPMPVVGTVRKVIRNL